MSHQIFPFFTRGLLDELIPNIKNTFRVYKGKDLMGEINILLCEHCSVDLLIEGGNVFVRRGLSCFLIFIALLVSSCISLDKNEIKNYRAEVTTINLTARYIAVKVVGKDLKIHIKGDTKLTKGDKDISFSELSVGDKVDISYVCEKRFGLWDFGGPYTAKTIKVL